ncbi:unnamed protein product [Citrullus colocynthis]|uniref:Uncharacterized protein n=1 Tax=Citrullus colocynthis TaxID=252529 RepID=A0ABP0YYS1_9ROSI
MLSPISNTISQYISLSEIAFERALWLFFFFFERFGSIFLGPYSILTSYCFLINPHPPPRISLSLSLSQTIFFKCLSNSPSLSLTYHLQKWLPLYLPLVSSYI